MDDDRPERLAMAKAKPAFIGWERGNDSMEAGMKPTAEESEMQEKQNAASQVWSDGMRVIYQQPELAGEVADALKAILGKVPAEGPGSA